MREHRRRTPVVGSTNHRFAKRAARGVLPQYHEREKSCEYQSQYDKRGPHGTEYGPECPI